MVILKTLLDRGELASGHGRILLGMLIVQDLAVVVLIVLLPALATGGDTALYDLAWTLARAVAFIAATLFLGTRVVPRLMTRVERLRSAELFLLTAVALALGAATVSTVLGLSPALGAFMAGLMLSETEFDHRVVAEVVPMRNPFATLFFVSVGMLIDPAFIVENLLLVVGMALFIVLVKALTTAVAIVPFRLGSKTTVFTSQGMIQIGEFSYVLARAGRETGAVSDTLNNLVLTSSVLTIVLTPLAFRVAPRIGRALAHAPMIGALFAARAAGIEEEDALDGHAVVIGYGRVGRQVATGLRGIGLPMVVIEEDLQLVQELTAAGVPAIYGDASHATILAAAHSERARVIVVALPDAGATRVVVRETRRVNPTAPILARGAREEEDAVPSGRPARRRSSRPSRPVQCCSSKRPRGRSTSRSQTGRTSSVSQPPSARPRRLCVQASHRTTNTRATVGPARCRPEKYDEAIQRGQHRSLVPITDTPPGPHREGGGRGSAGGRPIPRGPTRPLHTSEQPARHGVPLPE